MLIILCWFLCMKETHEASVSLARKYLEDKVSSEVISNYSLCLTAYALALVNSPVSFTALTQLSKRADYISDSAFFLSEAFIKPAISLFTDLYSGRVS